MSRKLKHSLTEAVRRFAFRTTVSDLQKRGVRNVNVLGLDRIVGLVEEAVRRTLARSLHMGQGTPRTGLLAADAKEEFIRLLEHAKDMERARDEALQVRQELEEEIDRLRLQFHETRSQLDAERQRIQESVQAQALLKEQKLAEAVRTLLAGSADLGADPGLADRVISLVTSHVDQELNRSLTTAKEEMDVEVLRLRRRVTKLADNLERAEETLRSSANGVAPAPGISSVFKSVQGLDGQDPRYREKQSVLKNIFEANLALRDKFQQLATGE